MSLFVYLFDVQWSWDRYINPDQGYAHETEAIMIECVEMKLLVCSCASDVIQHYHHHLR